MNFNCEDQGDLEGKTFAFVSDFYTFPRGGLAPPLPTPHRSARAPLMTAGFGGSRLQVRAVHSPPAPPGPAGAFREPAPLAGPPGEEARSPACGLPSTKGPDRIHCPHCTQEPGLAGGQAHP